MMAGYLTSHKKSSDRVVYTFEQVPKGRGEIDKVFYLVADHEALRRDFAYSDHGFKSKKECPLLEPADFIAWEWSRFQVSRLDKAEPTGCISEGYSRASSQRATSTSTE